MKWTLFCALAAGLLLSTAAAVEPVPYGVADARWPTELGNHRAVLHGAQEADAVLAVVPWRRRDPAPEKKDVVVTTAEGKTVANRVIVSIGRERGEVVFQPEAGPGDYYVYFMPFTENRSPAGYATHYTPPRQTADAAWPSAHGLTPEGLAGDKWRSLPQAEVRRFETWSPFHRFDPMEVTATADETAGLLARHPDLPLFLFPEDRSRAIRMTGDLPRCWIDRGPGDEFRGRAQPGEFYVFQIGVWAAREPVDELAVELSDLRSESGTSIPAGAIHAFNFRGTDWLGRPFRRRVSVPQGRIAPLWYGVPVPADAAGTLRGTVALGPEGGETQTVRVAIEVSGEVLPDHGVGDPDRLARLEWLDSTIGLDHEVVAPYTPLAIDGRTVACLGRSVTFGPSGLPEAIQSSGRDVLASPIAMIAETAAGPLTLSGGEPTLQRLGPGTVVCRSASTAGPLGMSVETEMEFNGYQNVRVTLSAREAVDLEDVRLEIPLRPDAAKYMMGFGRKGGFRSKEPWKWTWDLHRANNMVWLGDFDAGLQCKLKGPRDTWDLFDLSAGGIPDSWGNEGRGGAVVAEEGDAVVVRAFSGPRSLAAGGELEFRFGLLITPVKPLDPAHWDWRYYHFYAPAVPVERIAETGATIINCHHGNQLNPYINYPFRATGELGAYVREAHARDMKVKIYYTVRELSNHVAEMWPLRSLGREVFLDGPGGGHSWLQEHLVDHYAPAWHQTYPDGDVDAAIATAGLSRWHNYYLEGLAWLVREMGVDGLYLDGIGYDRQIMKRVRKVMDRQRPGCLIDFHSGNEFGFRGLRISPANKYMEHFPYINSLWFGEGYNYDESPDYWLVEMSGIPFGLTGEMLQGGGNPWRGMVYGMTNRLGWGGDPRAIWKLWDDFGIRDAKMIGYWDAACPVHTGREDVLATAYVKPEKTLVAVASWAAEQVECRRAIDWERLGLDPEKAHLFAPAVEGFQPAALFSPDDTVPIYPGRGWLLVLDEAEHELPASTTADVYKDRKLLLEEKFAGERLGDDWKIVLSDKPGTSLAVSDGSIAIEAPANVFAFTERSLPDGVRLVECSVFSGTDKGATWGPGLSVLWPGGVVRINLRAEGRYGVDDGAHFTFAGFVAPAAWHRLRVRIEEKAVVAEASTDGRLWQTLATFPRDQFPGDPTAVRLGKTGPGGRPEDYSTPGPSGKCRINELRAYGGLP